MLGRSDHALWIVKHGLSALICVKLILPRLLATPEMWLMRSSRGAVLQRGCLTTAPLDVPRQARTPKEVSTPEMRTHAARLKIWLYLRGGAMAGQRPGERVEVYQDCFFSPGLFA